MPSASSARAHSTSASWAKRVTATQARDDVGRRSARGGCDSIPAMDHGRRNRMLRTLLVSLVALLALPAAAFAAGGSGGHTDRTTEIMLGIIGILLLAMVLIGVLESRKH